ncbi:MAG: hypothetical protein ACM34K_13215 [Bacillota bacterium]
MRINFNSELAKEIISEFEQLNLFEDEKTVIQKLSGKFSMSPENLSKYLKNIEIRNKECLCGYLFPVKKGESYKYCPECRLLKYSPKQEKKEKKKKDSENFSWDDIKDSIMYIR